MSPNNLTSKFNLAGGKSTSEFALNYLNILLQTKSYVVQERVHLVQMNGFLFPVVQKLRKVRTQGSISRSVNMFTS